MNKKFQIFISSTYLDLQEERQAAVQAILDAGHIPAGMELFKSGNNSQLEAVEKWIDESDIYMLILGGRYGSLEPLSQKSYTQIEYEYALHEGIPVFAVVLSDTMLHKKAALDPKTEYFERDNIVQYSKFKQLVLSKIVRKIDEIKDINIAVLSSLYDFARNPKIRGWVRETETTTTQNVLHKCYKCGKEEILPVKPNYNSESGVQNFAEINSWHIIDAGVPGYGSTLDSLNLKFELCDDCMQEFVDSLKLKDLIYGEI